MANEPQDPITYFAGYLEQQAALKQNRVPVYPWRKSQAKTTSARRIVLYPTKSGLPSGASIPRALCDVEQHFNAECWGKDGPETWSLMTWLIQALEQQGIGTDGSPGFYWELLGSDWETKADTGTQGEVVTVLFLARFTITAAPYDYGKVGEWPTGEIDSTSQTVVEAT